MNINLEGKGDGAERAAACLIRHMLANPGVQYRTRDAAACSAVLDALGLVAGDDYEMEESRVAPGVYTISWITGRQHVCAAGTVSEWSTPGQLLAAVEPTGKARREGEPFNPYLHLAETTWGRLGMKRDDSSPILPSLYEMERAVRGLHGALDGMSREQLFTSDSDNTGVNTLVHSIHKGERTISPGVFMHAPIGMQWNGNWDDDDSGEKSSLVGYFADTVPQGYEDPSKTYLVLMEASVSGENGAATDETIRFVYDWNNVRRHIEAVMSEATGLTAVALPCTRLTSTNISVEDGDDPCAQVNGELLNLEDSHDKSGRQSLTIRCAVILGDGSADGYTAYPRQSAPINFKPTGDGSGKDDGETVEKDNGVTGLMMPVREQLTKEWLWMTHFGPTPDSGKLLALEATDALSKFTMNAELSSTGGVLDPQSPGNAVSSFCSSVRSAIREASGGRMVRGSVANRRAGETNSVLVSLWSGMTTDMSPRFESTDSGEIRAFPVPPEEGADRSTVTRFIRFLDDNPSIQTEMSKRHVGTGRYNHIVIDTNISYESVASDESARNKMAKRIGDSFEYAFCRNIVDPMASFSDRNVERAASFSPWKNGRGIDQWTFGNDLTAVGGVTDEMLRTSTNDVASIVATQEYSYSNRTRKYVVIDRSKLGIRASLLESEDGNLVIVVTSPVSDTWVNRLSFRMACGVNAVQEKVKVSGPYFISDGSARETAEFAAKMRVRPPVNSRQPSSTAYAWVCTPRVDELYARTSYSWPDWEEDDNVVTVRVAAEHYRDWSSVSQLMADYRELLARIMG